MRSPLSKNELKHLNQGLSKKIQVKAHERSVVRRNPQRIKDRTIHEFTMRYAGQLTKHGMTDADRRHLKVLVEIIDDLRAERKQPRLKLVG